jgi:hypothetical protein
MLREHGAGLYILFALAHDFTAPRTPTATPAQSSASRSGRFRRSTR